MDLTAAMWRKSTYSTSASDGQSCVEVAALPAGTIAVRDTKDRTQPPLAYPTPAWVGFLTALRP